MTSDPDERNSISTYRQVAANSAGFIVACPRHPHGPVLRPRQRRAWLSTHDGPAFGPEHYFLYHCISHDKRAHPARPAAEIRPRPGSLRLFRNGPWIVLFLATFFYFAAIVIRGNVMLPYCRYVAGNLSLFSWLNGFGLAALIAGVTCSTAISKRVGKRQLFIASMILTGAFAAALLMIPSNATVLIVATEVLRQFSYGYVRTDHLVDDGRRGRLRRMEDRPPRQRHSHGSQLSLRSGRDWRWAASLPRRLFSNFTASSPRLRCRQRARSPESC